MSFIVLCFFDFCIKVEHRFFSRPNVSTYSFTVFPPSLSLAPFYCFCFYCYFSYHLRFSLSVFALKDKQKALYTYAIVIIILVRIAHCLQLLRILQTILRMLPHILTYCYLLLPLPLIVILLPSLVYYSNKQKNIYLRTHPKIISIFFFLAPFELNILSSQNLAPSLQYSSPDYRPQFVAPNIQLRL